MCSIMGYCSEAADYEQFRKGFDKTLSRGPDDSRIVDKGCWGFTGWPSWDCSRRGCSLLRWMAAMWSATVRSTALSR